MKLFIMAKKTKKKTKGKKQPSVKVLNFQSILLREARKFALLVCACAVPVYVFVLTLPEEKRLVFLEQEFKRVQKDELVAIEANDRITREISAYKSNPEYLEIIARDHLNFYKEGETIIRIDR